MLLNSLWKSHKHRITLWSSKAPLWKSHKQKNAQASLAFFLIVWFIRDRDRIRTYDRLLRRQMLYPAELRDLTKNPCKWFTHKGLSGETGIRTQATFTRWQISNLLHYHSGTSPFWLTKLVFPKKVNNLFIEIIQDIQFSIDKH